MFRVPLHALKFDFHQVNRHVFCSSQRRHCIFYTCFHYSHSPGATVTVIQRTLCLHTSIICNKLIIDTKIVSFPYMTFPVSDVTRYCPISSMYANPVSMIARLCLSVANVMIEVMSWIRTIVREKCDIILTEMADHCVATCGTRNVCTSEVHTINQDNKKTSFLIYYADKRVVFRND